MATLLLTAVGTYLGGPIGGSIGAFAGQQIDAAIFGGGSREGPRLKELAATTSSYGQAIPRIFGEVRAPGTIIWSTNLVESKETSGGGKGKPKITTYSYTVSFAVALSSTPVQSIGRIWADGNLLRGSAGDLKVGGTMRFHSGYGDQQPDPLIASAEGTDCPGFRGLAYVVFEDLQLGDFGNRIPALTFEIFARDPAPLRLSHLLGALDTEPSGDVLEHILGFSDEGASMENALATLSRVYALSCVTSGTGLRVGRVEPGPGSLPELTTEVAGEGNPTGGGNAPRERTRQTLAGQQPFALRYYDRDRDYQPGLQHAPGQALQGQSSMVELPATMAAASARALSLSNAQNWRWQRDKLSWKVAELDPALRPGAQVTVPGHAGIWLIDSWEWLDRGIELTLERLPPGQRASVPADAGSLPKPVDLVAMPTQLRAFELPSDGTAEANSPIYAIAASASGQGWTGAALYAEQGDALVPLGLSTRNRSTMGHLADALLSSESAFFERDSVLEVDLVSEDLSFENGTIASLAAGANRLFVGGEIVQFCTAQKIGDTRWQLGGLLRGRGGTEHIANQTHPAGTPVISLDDSLTIFSSPLIAQGATTRVAAIGLADEEPSYADLVSSGISLAPLAPVHSRVTVSSSGDWHICWTRRARGQWLWLDQVGIPLVEESESYLVGAGPDMLPLLTWSTSTPSIQLSQGTIAGLVADHGMVPLWVKQIGTFGASPAALIGYLS